MTANLRIYPSTLPGEPLESYTVDGVTLEQWLTDNVPSFRPGHEQPISATVNGVVVSPAEWSSVWVTKATDIELRPQPQGSMLVIAAIAGAVAVAATLLLKPSIPGQNQKTNRGSSIYEANAQGNKPKLGDVIPEIAGRHKTYPDYLTAPRRYFANATTQALDLLLCVGKGEFTIPASEFKIGATPIGSLGSDVKYQIFQPGENVTSHQAHANWYNAPEVGASTGSSGLRLKSGKTYQQVPDASTYVFNGNLIGIPRGAGQFPFDWEAEMKASVALLQEIDVTDGGQDSNGNYLRDVLEGTFTAYAPGDAITISGGTAIGGDYIVNSYTPRDPADPDSLDQLTLDNMDSTPAAFLAPGMYMAAIDYTGVRYRIDDIILYRDVAFSLKGGRVVLDAKHDFGDLEIKDGQIVGISGTPNDGQYTAKWEIVDEGTEDEREALCIYNPDGTRPAVDYGTFDTNIINVTTGNTGKGRVEGSGQISLGPIIYAYPREIIVTRLNPDGSVDTGWTGFAQKTTPDARVTLDTSGIEGFWSGPFLACPEGETTSRIEWDIFAPQGLGYIEDDGDLEHRNRTVELQYRPLGGTSWTSVRQTVGGGTRNQLGWTFSVDLPRAMTPEVRVRRTSSEDTSTQAMDRLEWYGLRCRLPTKSSYPGVTVIAITLVGSDTIASQTENQVSVVATRKLPVRSNGTWSAPQATRDIAPWFVYVAKSVGYTDDEIDYDELDRLDAIWKARGDYYDFVQDSESTVKESLNRALRPGFSELTVDAGRLRPVRDEPRSTPEHMYSPQNMTGPLVRSVNTPRPDDPDGVDVEYFSAETWTQETVQCRLPGDNGFKAEKLRLEGVTSRTKAWQIGMRERRRQKYRRWTYSFETELDALNSRYMSFAALGDDVPGYAQSAWIKAIRPNGESSVLTVSEPLDWVDGENHVIAWRKPDGRVAGPYPATRGSTDYEVIAAMDEAPDLNARQEPPYVLFGTTERWHCPVLISDITPEGFESVSVQAVNYAPEVYADDSNSPPA